MALFEFGIVKVCGSFSIGSVNMIEVTEYNRLGFGASINSLFISFNFRVITILTLTRFTNMNIHTVTYYNSLKGK